MDIILVVWRGGVEWNIDAPSSFNPTKKKSATEHLIETGGLDIDEAIDSFDKFKHYQLKVSQSKVLDDDVNWITEFIITENTPEKAAEVKKLLIENYSEKQQRLKSTNSKYSIEIIETTTDDGPMFKKAPVNTEASINPLNQSQ